MVKEGFIRRFCVDLDHSLLGRPIVAYVDIVFKGSFTYEIEHITLDYISKINGVRLASTTVGEKYITVKIRTQDLKQLNHIVRTIQNDLPDATTRTVLVNELYFSNKKISYS